MATPTDILRDLKRGMEWHSDLVEKRYVDMSSGCTCCGNSILDCLHSIIKGLKYRTDLGIFDDVTDKLHSDMMELLGPIRVTIGPIVNAGPGVDVQEPDTTATLTGSVTAGDSPIDTIEWTQISGPNTATIDDPDTAVTDISGLVAGTYVFRLTAIDENNMTGYDETVVTVIAATMSAYYGYTADGSIPNIATILSSPSVLISGNSFLIPFTDNGSPRWSWVAYPQSFASMNRWIDANDPNNNGNIGTPTDLFGPYTNVSDMRVTSTQYPTQLRNTIFEE